MKVNSIVVVLRDFEALVEAVDGHKTLQNVREFRDLLVGNGETTVAQFVSKLLKGRGPHESALASPPIRQLQDVLAKFHALLVSVKSNKVADDVSQLLTVLRGSEHGSVSQFVMEAKSWLAASAKPDRPSRARGKKTADEGLGLQQVNHYADALRQASGNNIAFDELVEKLRSDKQVKKDEMREIAKIFLGHELAKKKGRKDALTDIVERQGLDARQEARGRVLDRLKSW